MPEPASRAAQGLFERDSVIVAWWATEIECTSAIACRQRLGALREDVSPTPLFV